MESGSNKSLFTLIAVVVFGIFLSLSYYLFQDQFKGILASVVDGVNSGPVVRMEDTLNPPVSAWHTLPDVSLSYSSSSFRLPVIDLPPNHTIAFTFDYLVSSQNPYYQGWLRFGYLTSPTSQEALKDYYSPINGQITGTGTLTYNSGTKTYTPYTLYFYSSYISTITNLEYAVYPTGSPMPTK